MKRAACTELRDLMVARCNQIDPQKKATVALSGGIDSVTMLFAMLESGRRPRCYTFYADGYESPDLLAARRVTKHFGLEHVEVAVSVDHDQMVADIRHIINNTCKVKKTIIQCVHPWVYTAPAMKRHGDDHILIGFAAGNFFNLSRRDNKALRALGEEEFLRQGWRDHKFTDLRFVDGNVAYYCKTAHGIHMDDWYACDPICNWFKKFKVAELHQAEDGSRLEKAPCLYAFEDYYKQGPFANKPSSYQVNSKIRDFHDGLLWNPKYNPGHKHQHIIAIYNRIANGVI